MNTPSMNIDYYKSPKNFPAISSVITVSKHFYSGVLIHSSKLVNFQSIQLTCLPLPYIFINRVNFYCTQVQVTFSELNVLSDDIVSLNFQFFNLLWNHLVNNQTLKIYKICSTWVEWSLSSSLFVLLLWRANWPRDPFYFHPTNKYQFFKNTYYK